MDLGGGRRDVVDPDVRAHVSSLVTALGGSALEEDGRYVLGDDGLACLRDLKRWLKLYDGRANRFDVARCLAESNIVGGDLLKILAAWPQDATEDRLKSRIALACLELLVPLTWPLEKDPQTMTVNHHRHIPYLENAQLGYKRLIINFDGAQILHTAVRCALPAIADEIGQRNARDVGIIKIVLYFLRNIVVIAPPPNVQYEGDEAEISRSTTIDAFDYQDIFAFLLTLSSNMGQDFNTEDVVVLDILFHLIKGVNIEKLFVDESKVDDSKGDELKQLRQKEAAMVRSYEVNAPTRHTRFGAMAWLRREDSKMTTISGQAAIMDSTRSLAKMDSTKKFKPPSKTLKGEKGPMDFDTPVMLNVQATNYLRKFVEDFLDSGFNPLFSHLRKAIDREAERVLEYHPRQFFYLISWFLEAERARRKSKRSSKPTKGQKAEEVDNFSLVASVLNQEMFVTLNRAMEQTFENKSWQDLSAAMRCFTQILLTVQEMSDSPLEEDQEIAENILSRIFYEDTTHDRIANMTRTYKDQGFGYLDSLTELTHNYIRILEQYSKQNVDMQVRSRRRTRRKKKAAKAAGDDDADDDDDGSDGEDAARAEKVSSERKFDFKRFAARFLTQGCIDTFVTFTAYYNDLKAAQLKRSHRFFYRVAFKQDMSVMLFRVDIIALLHKMIKGPEGLDHQASCFKEWADLVSHILRRCLKKIDERPELVVEMLFSKINNTAHYLEYGYEKQTSSAKPRAAAELEVKGGKEWEEQVAIVVGAMLDRNEGDLLQWLKSQLSFAESERRSWEGLNVGLHHVEKAVSVEEDPIPEPLAETDATPVPVATVEQPAAPTILVKVDNDSRRTALFKNGFLRLLMKLVGLRRGGEDDDPYALWTVPSTISADQLKEAHDLIQKSEFSPPSFDDGEEAGDFIRRESAGTAARKKAVFDDEDDGVDEEEEEFLFPAGGPTAMKKSDALKALKKNRRRRRKEGSDDEGTGLTDEQLQARNAARRERELVKNRKIKSDLFVHDSDEEDNEERDRAFYAQEALIRERAKENIKKLKALLNVGDEESSTETKSKKRQAAAILEDSDEENQQQEEDDDDVVEERPRKRQASAISIDSDEEELVTTASGPIVDSDGNSTNTPLSSAHSRTTKSKRRKVASDEENDSVEASPVVRALTLEEDDDDEDMAPVARKTRQRTRAGFIVDSDDE